MGGGKGKQLTTVLGAALGTAIGAAAKEVGNLVPSYVHTVSYYMSNGKVTATVPQEAASTLRAIARWSAGFSERVFPT